jgi:hypothetical protein
VSSSGDVESPGAVRVEGIAFVLQTVAGQFGVRVLPFRFQRVRESVIRRSDVKSRGEGVDQLADGLSIVRRSCSFESVCELYRIIYVGHTCAVTGSGVRACQLSFRR